MPRCAHEWQLSNLRHSDVTPRPWFFGSLYSFQAFSLGISELSNLPQVGGNGTQNLNMRIKYQILLGQVKWRVSLRKPTASRKKNMFFDPMASDKIVSSWWFGGHFVSFQCIAMTLMAMREQK